MEYRKAVLQGKFIGTNAKNKRKFSNKQLNFTTKRILRRTN